MSWYSTATTGTLMLLTAGLTAIRGGLFTWINERMYTAMTRHVFMKLTGARMEAWDTQLNTEDMSKVVMGDIAEVVQSASLLVNVFARTITTILSVSWIVHGISPELYVWSLFLSLLHVVVFHYLHPWHNKFADASRDAKNRLESHMNEYVLKHTSLLLYSWQHAYQSIYTSREAAYRSAIPHEARSYGTLILVGGIVPRLSELLFIILVIRQGMAPTVVMEVLAYYHMLNDAIASIKDQSLTTWRIRERVDRLWSIYVYNPISSSLDQSLDQSHAQSHSHSHAPLNQDLTRFIHPYYDQSLYVKANNKKTQLIHIDNLYFTYPTSPSKTPIFEGLNLDIMRGEHVAVIARSGRGKTTLIKLLLGLYPYQGTLKIEGRDVHDIPSAELKTLISVVPQEPLIFPDKSLAYNLCMGHDEQAINTWELPDILDRVCLSELKHLLIGDPPLVEVSGGQRQRIAIARMLLNKAPIMILDEPTSALDEETTKEVMHAIREHAKTKTVIFITHNKALAKDMRHISLG